MEYGDRECSEIENGSSVTLKMQVLIHDGLGAFQSGEGCPCDTESLCCVTLCKRLTCIFVLHRIVLICAKRSLCAAFSVLPYGESFYIRYYASPRSRTEILFPSST